MKNSNINNKILYLGIGVFLLILIWETTSIVQDLVFDLLVSANSNPILILWSKLAVQLLVYTLGFIIGINYINNSKKNGKIILRNFIVFFFLILILGSIYIGAIQDLIRTDSYHKVLEKYTDYTKLNYSQLLVISLLGFLVYIIPGLIIYKNLNKNSG
jgi:hypothetical protein